MYGRQALGYDLEKESVIGPTMRADEVVVLTGLKRKCLCWKCCRK